MTDDYKDEGAPIAEKLLRPTSKLDEILGLPFPVLDGGFVRVIDYMGNEAAIVQMARTSYGEGTKKIREDIGLIRYLMRHNHCYDDQTEVLTDKGFIPWESVGEGTRLGVFDPEKNTLCYEVPDYLTRDRYQGEMYRVDHGGVDLCVTPNHKMWVKLQTKENGKNKWSDWSLQQASDLGNRSMVRYSKIAPDLVSDRFIGTGFPECDDPEALLELIGFFIGDGSAVSENSISFNIRKKRKRDFLAEVCIRLGWELRERTYSATSIVVKGIGSLFASLFYEKCENGLGQKFLPLHFCRLHHEDAKAVLRGLRASDGTQKRGAWSYATVYKKTAENFQILALHAGEAAHISAPGAGSCWRVMVLSRMREPVVNQSRRNTSIVPYDGIVYCAKTRTGILVVRRNGKVVLSGNSTPFEACELKLHIRIPMDVWRQMVRHRAASYFTSMYDEPSVNEYSTRYSVAIDSQLKTDPKKWRLQAKSNRQGSYGNLSAWPDNMDRKEFMNAKTKGMSPGEFLSEEENRLHDIAWSVYKQRLELGIAREQARKDLPLSSMTEAYWKVDLHNLLHFLALRLDTHSQYEIRQYAQVIWDEILPLWVPNVRQAFDEYHPLRSAKIITGIELQVIFNAVSNGRTTITTDDLPDSWLKKGRGGNAVMNRECLEFLEKAKRLGFTCDF